MGLPAKLKNFATFIDGENYMGVVPEVTLPTLTRKMEEYRGGGMNMPVDMDMGMEKMEAEIKAAGWFGALLKTWGEPKHDGVMLRFAGALQADDTGVIQACEVVLRGRFAEFDRQRQSRRPHRTHLQDERQLLQEDAGRRSSP